MMEWQSIETARKDHGQWILAWDGEEVQALCWIDCPDEYDSYTGWAYGKTRWGGTLYEGWNEFQRIPTHWMPLPPPPKDTP